MHPEDGEELSVQQGPPEGGAQADFPESPEHFAPGYDPGELAEIAKKMMDGSRGLESGRVLVAGRACRLRAFEPCSK